MDYSTDYLTSPEHARIEAERDTMTTKQLERLNRLQEAQVIVMQTTDAQGTRQIMQCVYAVQMAMANDDAAPVETLVDDALRILGVGR